MNDTRPPVFRRRVMLVLIISALAAVCLVVVRDLTADDAAAPIATPLTTVPPVTGPSTLALPTIVPSTAPLVVDPTTTVQRTTISPTTVPSTTVPASTEPPSSEHFSTLPVGSALPTEAKCASQVRSTTEIRPDNDDANHTRGSKPLPENSRVTGNFVGTTDEIIQWAACKWGIDEDIVRAQIAKESYWFQSSGGDYSSDQSHCYPPLQTTDGSQCPESYGLGQVRYPYHMSAMADSVSSSAFNLDYTYSLWRTCFDGTDTWLNQYERGKDYVAGDVWGCVGLWFSGRWYTQPANDYISAIQGYFAMNLWTTSDFIDYTR
jgi:hypothetical protein